MIDTTLEDEDAAILAGAAQFAEIQESIRQMEAALVGVTNEELASSAVDADASLVHWARKNVNVFCEYVLRDELTGKPHGAQESHHIEWHGLANAHDRLILWSFPEAGKSVQLSIGRTLWLLGRNPNLRLVIISETHSLAKKLVRTIGRYIETSDELHRVFPGLRPGKDAPWTETYIYVERQTHGKDPSVQAFGLHGRIWGARVDGMILDDILSPDNTRTKAARDDTWNWLEQIQTRLSDGGFILAVGNAFHPDDVLHRLSRNDRWVWRRFPVLTQDGQSSWPKRWPLARIGLKRRDMGGGAEFARQFLCQARSDEDARFKQAWIDLCLARGDGRTMVGDNANLTPLAAEAADRLRAYAGIGTSKIYTGVDLAIQKHEAADLTVFFTIRAHGNGDREVLEIFSGRLGAPEILAKMREVYSRYASIFIVENNAAQEYIVQMMASQTAIPVRGFTTGRNKAHPEFGIESLSNEMANAKWIIPNRAGTMHPEVSAWVNEMLYYDPRGHTGDRLMASWFAREGIRMGEATIPVAETGRISW